MVLFTFASLSTKKGGAPSTGHASLFIKLSLSTTSNCTNLRLHIVVYQHFESSFYLFLSIHPHWAPQIYVFLEIFCNNSPNIFSTFSSLHNVVMAEVIRTLPWVAR